MSPLTKEQADQAIANLQSQAAKHGVWEKVCNGCQSVVGGRLANYGKPTEEDLARICCPVCRNGIDSKQGFFTRLSIFEG